MEIQDTQDVVPSRTTRMMCVYSVTARVPGAEGRVRLADLFDLGYLRRHADISEALLPRAVIVEDLPAPHVASIAGAQLANLRLIVLVTPLRDILVVFEGEFAGDPGLDDVIEVLTRTYRGRDSMTVGDTGLLDWLTERLGAPERLRFGFIHQMVFAGGRLADTLLMDGTQPPRAAVELIIRGGVPTNRGAQLGIRTPAELHNPGRAMVAHGRGVTVTAGWAPHVQNAFALMALMTIGALGVLGRARTRAFGALGFDLDLPAESTARAGEQLAQLAALLADIQLDLSFGVEPYLDSAWFPTMRAEAYLASLLDRGGVEASRANTSRMVERLAAVIQARAAVLAAADRDQRQRQDRVLSVVLAIGSLIALPPSLLLAFFGVTSSNTDPHRSILDLGHYWPAYVLAWVPFAVLILVGFMLRRRVRTRSAANRTGARRGRRA